MQKAVLFTGIYSTRSILLAGLFVLIEISSLGFAHAQSPGITGIPREGCFDTTCDIEPRPNYSRTCDCDLGVCYTVLCNKEPEHPDLTRPVAPEPLELSDSILGALLIAAVFGGVAAALFIRGKSGRYVLSPLLLLGITVIMITICFILFHQTCVTTRELVDPPICEDPWPGEHTDHGLICRIHDVKRCTSAWNDMSQFLATPFK